MTVINGPILFNSSTGSDTQASGCGPSSAVFGTTGTCSSGSAVVTGIDTTGVSAGDLFWGDTSSGRQFSVIASVDSGTQITLDDNLAANHSGNLTWAIGGVRQFIATADSKKLVENGGTFGDAHTKGWTIELQDGFAETITATFDVRVDRDSTNGRFVLRGESGSSVVPCLTFSNNGNAIVWRGNGQLFQDFEMRNSNATKTASYAFAAGSAGTNNTLRRVKINHTNKFWRGVLNGTVANISIENCDIGQCADNGLQWATGSMCHVTQCYIHNCGGDGIEASSTGVGCRVTDCIIANNAGAGIVDGQTRPIYIASNIIYGNGGAGIERSVTLQSADKLIYERNILVGNSVGIDLTYASPTVAHVESGNHLIRNNAHYNNTGGFMDAGFDGVVDFDTIALSADPFVDAANGDFNINNTAGGGADLRAATLMVAG